MLNEERYLTISEMSEIHNITRQTLLYYDKIDLFKPIMVDENGYRYYSSKQIPILREICFLKSTGIKLEEIKEHIYNRNLTTAISLLKYHKENLENEIEKLKIAKESIENRLNIYEKASVYNNELNFPILENFSERKVIFISYENEVNKEELHLTMMNAWKKLANYGLLPSKGFGTIILNDSIGKENILEGAGVYISLPIDSAEGDDVKVLPAGKYVCMYKYAMPYETSYLYNLLDWINKNNYEIVGDIVDACILDTTFYRNNQDTDFCQLQIPVRKKK